MSEGAESRPVLSVVIPMFNEEDNVERTVSRVFEATRSVAGDDDAAVEILLIDDGSRDQTAARAEALGDRFPGLRVHSYLPNRGRGHALRTGYREARGEVVVTVDADLSYTPDHILKLYQALQDNPRADIAVGSPYMEGGRAENVPAGRLFVSRAANVILGFALGGELKTVTGILRAYRRQVLEDLELESDGKELHLEVVSKARALGYRFIEVPSVLRGRELGKSKLKLKSTTLSHLLFSFSERPTILFGAIGLLLLTLGLLDGLYILGLYLAGTLNPIRPLVTLLVLLLLGGVQAISLGFIGTLITAQRVELLRARRDIQRLSQQIARRDSGAEA